MYIYMYACIYICIHIYIYTHTHTHTHTGELHSSSGWVYTGELVRNKQNGQGKLAMKKARRYSVCLRYWYESTNADANASSYKYKS